MDLLTALIIDLIVIAVLFEVARRASIPYPALFVLGGLALGFIPGLPSIPLEPELVLRPIPSFSAELGFLYNRNVEDAQWVDEVTGAGTPHYIFGHLQQQTSSITIRANYTLTPNLSLQVYAEPFVSAGEYTGYKELTDGRAENWQDRYAPYAYTGNADFNYRSFRTTNVLRWEYKPGSTLFVVWQQGREETQSYGDFRFGRDFRGVFGIPASNVFLVKLSYWLNY